MTEKNASSSYYLAPRNSRHRIALPAHGEIVLGRFDLKAKSIPDVDLSQCDKENRLISRRHARIVGHHDRHYIEDLDSTNGTRVNSQWLVAGQKMPLEPGDEIALGDYVFVYAPALKTKNLLPSALIHAHLWVAFTGNRFPLPSWGEVIVGRSDRAKGIVPDIDLSKEGDAAYVVTRRHAKIIAREGRHYVEDLGSTNTTKLNGVYVNKTELGPLNPGDHLWLGGCVLVYGIDNERVAEPKPPQRASAEGHRRTDQRMQTTSPPVPPPLDQVRVLDLSRLLPGPYCSRILADFGAEVIKIEQPGGGDWLRHAPPLVDGEGILFQALNHGKKSLTLNLKSDEGRDILLRLIKTADVLLESFRPGVMERLGVGCERLAETNPRLVYCSLSGYGQDGPYRERAGHDLNYIGLTGLLDLTGPRDGPPAIPGVPIADLNGALWAAFGILSALLARERTGQGQRVDGSLLGGALAPMIMAVAYHLGGQAIERGGSTLTGGVVCYNVYETQDGRFVTLGALEPQFWAAFCRAVERDDLVTQQFAPATPGEPAYDELCALFRSRTRQQWTERMAGVDACCEPIVSLEEALASAPVQELGMVSGYGLLPPVRLSALSFRPADRAPALGEHTATLLAELGYDAATVEHLQKQGVL